VIVLGISDSLFQAHTFPNFLVTLYRVGNFHLKERKKGKRTFPEDLGKTPNVVRL